MVDTLPAAPVSGADRIEALDVLRGFALLGILLMNVQSMAMPTSAYFNPTSWGDLTGANGWVWTLSHVFADQKFMTLFSMLFGAGVLLFTSRIEARGGSARGLHYRRMFWLLLFGLVHAYLIWAGDILVPYAIAGAAVYLVRRWRPRTLIVVGLLVVALPSLFMALAAVSIPRAPAAAIEDVRLDWEPTAEMHRREIASYQGNWVDQMDARVEQSVQMHLFALPFWSLWRAGGLMLLGMALFKLGILSGERSSRFYARMAAVCGLVGFPVVAYGVVLNQRAGFDFVFSRFGPGMQLNYWASILVSLTYVALVMLFVHWGGLSRLRDALGAVGRTALTNYLLQSLIVTGIFYGHGLGLFSTVERSGQLAIVLAVWLLQLVVSPIWLRRYRFGPFEWLWRSLTYLRLQPVRR